MDDAAERERAIGQEPEGTRHNTKGDEQSGTGYKYKLSSV
jgi:hypothetical protein